MQGLELVLALLVVTAGLAPLARRIRVPFPVMLVVGGLLLALVPGLPPVRLDPEVVFLVFVPPLLYWAAINTSARDLRRNLRPISLLAVGLVLATAAVAAAVAHAALPGLPWSVAFVLGAIVSPPDAAAAISVARRLNVAPRLVAIIEGETLLNDTSAFVTYRMAVAWAVTGTFSLGSAALHLLLMGAGGVAAGFVVGHALVRLLRIARQAVVANTLSLLTPFAAYLPAERLGASGVLAVLTAGLIVARRSPTLLSPRARLQKQGLWDVLEFILTGLLFILLGLELGRIVRGVSVTRDAGFLRAAALVAAAVILTRIAWVFPSVYLPRLLSRRLRERDPVRWQPVALLAWTGMRGGDSLVMALAVPQATAAGAPFPARAAILLVSFAVIAATLVLQGMPLRLIVARLGLAREEAGDGEERAARQEVARAGLVRLAELADRERVPAPLRDRLRREVVFQMHQDLADLEPREPQGRRRGERDRPAARYRALLATNRHLEREVLGAERAAAIRLRDEEAISDEVLRRIEHDLDLDELRLEEDDVDEGMP